MSNVVLLGIDGATFDLLKPWIERGELPSFRKVLRDGTHGNMRTTIPCLSIPAIPALCTGLNLGKLGIFGFRRADGSLVTYNDVRENCVWDILADYGVRSCVVNVTGTYPPVIKNGIMIAGGAPSENSEYVYPKELKSRVRGFYSEFDLISTASATRLDPRTDTSRIVHLAEQIELKRLKTFEDLMEGGNFEFGVLWILCSDDIQHYYWGHEDILLDFFKVIDRILGELVQEFKEYSILIVSDHGFEAKPEFWFHVNYWLRNEGYLKTVGGDIWSGLILRLSGIIHKFWEFTPDRARNVILKLAQSRVTSTENETSAGFRDFLVGVDWKNTTAYTDSTYWGVRVHASSQALYENVRSEIIRGLQILNHKGNPIVREALRREAVYRGEYLDKIPDIVFLTEEGYRTTPFLSGSRLVTKISPHKERHLKGDHTNALNGVFVAYGPMFKKGYKVENVTILDVVPTILHIMGCDVPPNTDGRVLEEIFRVEYHPEKRMMQLKEHGTKIVEGTPISEEEKRKIKQRLKALGYID